MKNLILAAVAVFTFGAATAQDMKFGVKAGLNVATTSGSGVSSKIGANFGAFGEFKLADKFAIQPELLYSMQGAKISTSTDLGFFSVTEDNTLDLGYINIPIMAKYYVTEDLSLQAGPQIGFLMSAKITEKVTSSNQTFVANSETSSTDKSNLNSVDFGLNFGAGYNLGENFMVDLRYNLGLNNLQKNLVTGQTGTTNRVISLNFGYKF